jgi:Bacterial Ig-like domain (group 2)/Fibronectin type III domain
MSYIFAAARLMARRWSWLVVIPALAVCSANNPAGTTTANPGTASDLSVGATTDVTVSLSFTQVEDGRGQPANYDVRYATAPMTWGSAISASSGTCTTPVAGTAVGSTLSCTILGLSPSTSYNFQVLAFRGALNAGAVFGGLSNVAVASTAAPTPPPPVVTTVTVSPPSVSVGVGTTTLLQATVKDQNGNVMSGQTVTWSTDNAAAATVNSSGVVTGVAAGSATITATSSGKTGTSSITVTAAPPPPPPPPGSLLFQENFEDANLASRGWYDNTNVLLSTTEHIAGSNSSAQYRFLAGATTPTNGGAQRHKFPASNSFYLSYYVKYSTNWIGSNKAYHPHEFYTLSTLDGDWDGPSQNYLDVYVEQNYLNGGRPRIAIQDNKSVNYNFGALPNNLISVTEDRSVGGCNGVVETNIVSECFNFGTYWYNDKQLTGPVMFQPSPGPGYKNDWNFIEAYFQLNTIVNGIGQANGVVQYWFNGALIIDRHDILFRTGARPTLQFNQFLIAPYIGDGSPVDQSMWIDNLRLATSRIP